MVAHLGETNEESDVGGGIALVLSESARLEQQQSSYGSLGVSGARSGVLTAGGR